MIPFANVVELHRQLSPFNTLSFKLQLTAPDIRDAWLEEATDTLPRLHSNVDLGLVPLVVALLRRAVTYLTVVSVRSSSRYLTNNVTRTQRC